MKLLLALIIATVHSATITKRSADNIDLVEINNLRNEIANLQSGIRIPPLTYSKGLEAKAKSLSAHNCGMFKNGPSHRVMPADPDDNAKKLVALAYLGILSFASVPADKITPEISKAKDDFEEKLSRETSFHFELLNPSQTQIGCVPQACTSPIPPGNEELKEKLQLTGDIVVFNQMCILGPSGIWPKDQLASIEHAASKSATIKKLTEGSSGSSSTPIGMGMALILCFVLFM